MDEFHLHFWQTAGAITTFVVAPLIAVVWRGLNHRIQILEQHKVDKDVFNQLSSLMAEHRRETRDGLLALNKSVTDLILALNKGNNHD